MKSSGFGGSFVCRCRGVRAVHKGRSTHKIIGGVDARNIHLREIIIIIIISIVLDIDIDIGRLRLRLRIIEPERRTEQEATQSIPIHPSSTIIIVVACCPHHHHTCCPHPRPLPPL